MAPENILVGIGERDKAIYKMLTISESKQKICGYS